MFWKRKKVLVTGGAGFIGSNLVHELVRRGAEVTVVDSWVADHGANERNLAELRESLKHERFDLCEGAKLAPLIEGQDYIFNLAGQVSHADSMRDPLFDMHVNVTGHIQVLELCRKLNPRAKIVYTSTRQIYGAIGDEKKVSESFKIDPVDVNGINKLSGELYHRLYHRVYGLPTVALRLTNCYGPRQLIRHNRQGFIAWFLNRAMLGEKISLFGGGGQLRDFTFVDDVVAAMLLSAESETATGKAYNLGGMRPYSLREVAEILQGLCPKLQIESIPFPEERKKIDIGSYVADWTLVERELGWRPTVDLPEGLRRTVAYYQTCLGDYLG